MCWRATAFEELHTRAETHLWTADPRLLGEWPLGFNRLRKIAPGKEVTRLETPLSPLDPIGPPVVTTWLASPLPRCVDRLTTIRRTWPPQHALPASEHRSRDLSTSPPSAISPAVVNFALAPPSGGSSLAVTQRSRRLRFRPRRPADKMRGTVIQEVPCHLLCASNPYAQPHPLPPAHPRRALASTPTCRENGWLAAPATGDSIRLLHRRAFSALHNSLLPRAASRPPASRERLPDPHPRRGRERHPTETECGAADETIMFRAEGPPGRTQRSAAALTQGGQGLTSVRTFANMSQTAD